MFYVFFSFDFRLLSVDLLIFNFKFLSLLLVTLAFSLKSINPGCFILFVSVGLQCFPHAKSNGALIELLVVGMDHPVFVSHSDKQIASLKAIYGHFSNQLVEKLSEKGFTLLAHTILASGLFVQLRVKLLLKIDNVDLSCGLW